MRKYSKQAATNIYDAPVRGVNKGIYILLHGLIISIHLSRDMTKPTK